MIAWLFVLAALAGTAVLVVVFAAPLGGGVSVPPHRTTSRHAEVLFPFMADSGFPAGGVYIGDSQFGGAQFSLDLWEAYRRQLVTNANVVVAGEIGSGKSTLMKTTVARHAAFGRQSIVIDPKGEYGALAGAMGGTWIRLEPGGQITVNPLDATERQATEIVVGLASAGLERPLLATEEQAVTLAVQYAKAVYPEPTLPDVVAVLYHPTEETAALAYTTPGDLRAKGEHAAAALWNLCQGPLAGMFDGRTNIVVDWAAPVIVIDVSAVGAHNQKALAQVMAAALAWIRPVLEQSNGQRFLVVDEAWYLLSDPALVLWLQSMFKLSRQYGLSNVIVVHKFGDLRQINPDAAEVAQRLLSDAGTKILFAQSPDDAAVAAAALNLNATEAGYLVDLAPRRCLVRVGRRSWLVAVRISEHERTLTDTDTAMRHRGVMA